MKLIMEEKMISIRRCSGITKKDKYDRVCKICNNTIIYYSYNAWYKAKRVDSNCKKCQSNLFKGKGNPFYEKKHSDETRKILSDKRKGHRNSPLTEFKKGCKSNTIPVYECWVKKYGKDEADRRMELFRTKQSDLSKKNGNSYIKYFGKHYHRYVMEQHIGRNLKSEEIVHHIDGNKHNNSIDNLKIVTSSEHARIHFTKYKPICILEGCGKKHQSKGYCSKHLSQIYRHGIITNI